MVGVVVKVLIYNFAYFSTACHIILTFLELSISYQPAFSLLYRQTFAFIIQKLSNAKASLD
jgi:hypothetical protein